MPPRARATSDRSISEPAQLDRAASSAGSETGGASEDEVRVRAGAGGSVGEGDAPGGDRGATVGGGLRLGLPALPAGLPGGIDAKRLLWLGGLGALATIGILEWPVALVVGAGSVVAERWARENSSQQDKAGE